MFFTLTHWESKTKISKEIVLYIICFFLITNIFVFSSISYFRVCFWKSSTYPFRIRRNIFSWLAFSWRHNFFQAIKRTWKSAKIVKNFCISPSNVWIGKTSGRIRTCEVGPNGICRWILFHQIHKFAEKKGNNFCRQEQWSMT